MRKLRSIVKKCLRIIDDDLDRRLAEYLYIKKFKRKSPELIIHDPGCMIAGLRRHNPLFVSKLKKALS